MLTTRFPTRPGRKYADAKKVVGPYDKVKGKYLDARTAGKALIAEGTAGKVDRETFIYVNNRLVGNALETIKAMIADGD